MTNRTNILMLFDGVCGFCSRSVLFILKRTGSHVRFCAMQSPKGIAHLNRLHMPTDNYETLIVQEGDTILAKSDAVLHLAYNMRAPWPQLARIIAYMPKTWRDRAYDVLAKNRYRVMGKRTTCLRPDADLVARFDI